MHGGQGQVADMNLRQRRGNRFLQANTNEVVNSPASPSAVITPNEPESVSKSANVKEKFLLALRETITCRRAKNTPLFQFMKDGCNLFDKGWLRRELVDADTASKLSIRSHERKLIFFIFMGLSGTGPGVDDVQAKETEEAPVALLSKAWGFTKPSIRRVCGLALDDNILGSLLEDRSEEEGRKRVKSDTPQSKEIPESDPDGFLSPEDYAAPQARTFKRRDLKPTPTLLSRMENIALESPRTPQTPTSTRFFSFGQQDTNEQRRTRLDFGASPLVEEEIDESSYEGGHFLDAATQTEEVFVAVENRENVGTQTAVASRLASEMKEHFISRDCEEELCRALYFLFHNRAVNIDRTSKTNDNEVITIRQFRKGSCMKILRIKESRQTAKSDNRGRRIKGKAKLVETLLANMDISEQEVLSVLKLVAKNHSARVLNDDECYLGIQHCAALMQYLPLTARGVERLSRFFKAMLPTIGENLFPTMLRKKLSLYALESFHLRLGFELVSLEIGGEKRNERCLHVWVKEPAAVVESLTQSALLAGKLEESSSFCKHKNELVVVQGSDRGGDITLCLVRIANRAGGNAPQYCIPLAFYEYGKENYDNFQKTIFHPGKPTKQFLQKMLDGCFQMIVVVVEDDNVPVDAQCCIVECESALKINRLPDSNSLRLETQQTGV
ncbi:unknown protein [Seminavis robusta]|uniref:Uncharacterized protein n=1 Tax=Seminavis robusta TaxID=568900 RepID=A0A9N8EUX2_9STRA|nr:unknown protein [Seminavis robusta]|eukprot:Sro1641_g287980.1 n/a (671) ;mRNA; r:11102-13114